MHKNLWFIVHLGSRHFPRNRRMNFSPHQQQPFSLERTQSKKRIYARCLFRNAELPSTAKNSCAHYAESGYGERAKFKECFLEVLPSSLKVNAKKRAAPSAASLLVR
jgi:hypothetical protein